MARKTKQQALETRQQILDAALRIFSEHGVSATSLTDVATAAGVTRGAIYWHFKNKTELFDEIWTLAESKISDFEIEYQTKFPDNPLYVMRELLIYMLRLTVSDPQWRSMVEIIFHKCEFVGELLQSYNTRKAIYLGCYDDIENNLARCIRMRMLPADIHLRRAAIAMRAYFSGIMENWLFMPESFDLEQEAPALVDSFIDMLRFSAALRQPV
ncbi:MULTISPECIES: multidrug efflux transporter transcriptional repressor AcrR [unclassified Brenneria]|uniref:multidrug efflux transporter transcriptional repressor AcrR n=1 Tax=unclassified Brenneria TaxID=2634434 RepID=UPI00155176CA|nr:MULTISPECIES: multidrug efflux transporter transcriptional repressor AcrR [unclassified Brenneria]MBJ7221794.1 multidrug efflux transporter transcriptional repressor AcrR [Brenneria sp. L3-3C-1]MEE3643037.1 multidrug efflux transporter transcriptional repressor AcrR [Brenneria sp. L3_3C_1]MEE3650777.1 multidrug efflux transporter transcriptional repressor AcrR [Brenneria sp. HEZEL_4_2_4]NPD00732.1 multidrug efflux transporter transcriptional repressor AcrR [Brenneria sp. hezel4-2-4]